MDHYRRLQPGAVLFAILLGLLVWAPLPFGSNREWAWGIIEVVVFSVLFAYLVLLARGRLQVTAATRRAAVIIVVLVAWLAFQFFQVIPLPAEVVRAIDTARYTVAGDVFGEQPQEALALSFDVGASYEEALKNSAYVALFILVLGLADTRRRIMALVGTLVLSGVALATFGLYEYLTQQPSLGPQGVAFLRAADATFVNRNHFAAYTNVIIALVIGVILSRPTPGGEGRSHTLRSLEELLDWRSYAAVYLVIASAALIFTQSRGGITALVLSAMVVLIVLSRRSTPGRHNLGRLVAALLVAGVIAGFFGATLLSERMAAAHTDIANRLTIWEDAYRLFREFWLVGAGGGSFEYIFPAFDAMGSYEHVDHAHSDYLELLVEQGVIGFSLIMAAMLVALRAFYGGITRVTDRHSNGLIVGTAIGVLSMLFHGLVDFNFHIPANAAYFFVLLGLGLAQALPGDVDGQQDAS